MDENKEFNEENETMQTSVNEVPQEAVENDEMSANEALEDATQNDETSVTEPVAESECIEAVADVTEEYVAPQKKKSPAIVAAVLITLVATLAVEAAAYFAITYNPYNHKGYANISGMTIEDLAKNNYASLDEFLYTMGLPADMKANTYIEAAEAMLPLSSLIKQYQIDFATFKSIYKLPDSVTEDTTWGEAQDAMTLNDRLGGESPLASFKEEYGFGDEVTGDTLWGDIRKDVEKKQIQKAKEDEKASKNEIKKKRLEDATATAAPSAEDAAADPTITPGAETDNTAVEGDANLQAGGEETPAAE